MPIRARMSTSGEKKVFKKKRSNISGSLNRAARAISTAEAGDLTPGVVIDLNRKTTRSNRSKNRKQEAIIGNRRRRHAPHIGAGTLSRTKRS
jgi:hypothetical protein